MAHLDHFSPKVLHVLRHANWKKCRFFYKVGFYSVFLIFKKYEISYFWSVVGENIVKYFSQLWQHAHFFEICKKLNVNGQNYLDELHSIDGIGISQIDSLKKFFSNKQNLIVVSNLINLLDVENYKSPSKKTPLSGKLIMFTGGFEYKSRSELKSLAENLGAKIVSNISKKTNSLIVGSQKPTIKKINEAKKLNVKILYEKDWNKIIN